nr:hypothetical protein Iba_chr04fCG9060 [Ipomoea batatas]
MAASMEPSKSEQLAKLKLLLWNLSFSDQNFPGGCLLLTRVVNPLLLSSKLSLQGLNGGELVEDAKSMMMKSSSSTEGSVCRLRGRSFPLKKRSSAGNIAVGSSSSSSPKTEHIWNSKLLLSGEKELDTSMSIRPAQSNGLCMQIRWLNCGNEI